MVVERFLDALGQQAVCAPDIQNALRLLQARPIDLALIDMNLPDGDGRELLARLRALPAHAHTPAVLMSAHIPRREVDALLEAGFAAFLSKPFARERLRALLADLLCRARRPQHPRKAAGVAEVLQATDWIDADFLRAEREALGRRPWPTSSASFTQGQPLIDALLAAARAGEHEACTRLAHKLRGAAGNVGAGRLAECAGALEEALKPDPTGDAPRAGAIGDLAVRAGELGEAWSYRRRRSTPCVLRRTTPKRKGRIRPARLDVGSQPIALAADRCDQRVRTRRIVELRAQAAHQHIHRTVLRRPVVPAHRAAEAIAVEDLAGWRTSSASTSEFAARQRHVPLPRGRAACAAKVPAPSPRSAGCPPPPPDASRCAAAGS